MEQKQFLTVKMYGITVDTYKNYDIMYIEANDYVELSDLSGLTMVYLVNDSKTEVMELASFRQNHDYSLTVCGLIDVYDTSDDSKKFYKEFNKNKIDKIKTENQLLEKIKETLKILNY